VTLFVHVFYIRTHTALAVQSINQSAY